MQTLVAAVPAFLASVVEFVEALTIVLAVGVTRQWRSTLIGVGGAVLALAVIVGVFGTAIVVLVPIDILRLVVGTFLLIYGLQWLCKAILRAAGAKAKHDETADLPAPDRAADGGAAGPRRGAWTGSASRWPSRASCSRGSRSPSSSSPSVRRPGSSARPPSARRSRACSS